MQAGALVDFSPALRMALWAGMLTLLPLAWVWRRQRGKDVAWRVAALTAFTAFLTFDLIVFGAFTRLTDSGLGCPDWPGCYAEASPFGAHDEIHAAQSTMPTGPVTFAKAWIEMIHRYLAMIVGALILVAAVVAWIERRRLPLSPWWSTATLSWVIVQGLFGKFTVTLKLYPAIVTLHLLGGLVLLALLVVQREAWRSQPLSLTPALARGAYLVTGMVWVQMALGGWVSTNYAVLACTGFPQCDGQWWPNMNFAEGFTLLRELGRAGHGGFLSREALVAVHMVHRIFAFLLLPAMLAFAWRLHAAGGAVPRRYALTLAALALWQLASGLSNVVLGWPLIAALAHTAGAAAMVGVTASLLARLFARSPAASHDLRALPNTPA